MKMIPLAQLIQINPRMPRGLEDSREISFVAMASVSENGGITHQKTRKFSEVKKGFTYFERGDVLLAKITPCFENGKSAFADNLQNQIGFGSTEFHVLRSIPEKIDSNFLYHLVRSKRLLSLGRKSMKGAAGHKRVPVDFLETFEVPAWPLDDQIRIAHLLGKVERLIAQRKQHLQYLNDLLKSVFLEMFGDPVRNEKNWDKRPLEEFGSINRGISKHRPRNDPKLLGGTHPLIQTGEVSNSGTYIKEYTQTYSDIGFAQSKIWPAGTLCITIAANIAQTGILTFDACFPDSVVGFTANKTEANTIYVVGLFWFFQAILEKNAPAAAQKNINLEILRSLEVPKPPIELQNNFATIVEKVEGIKSSYQQSLTDLKALYGALSQQTFMGELDLSRVPLPTQSITPALIGDQATVPEPVVQAAPVIDLPASDKLPAALENAEARKALIAEWLEAYRQQLGDAPFSVRDFMLAASDRLTERLQTVVEDEAVADEQKNRLAEFYPSNDVGLDVNDYEHIKKWVFEALVANRLTQSRNVTGYDEQSGEPIFGNLIELKASQI